MGDTGDQFNNPRVIDIVERRCVQLLNRVADTGLSWATRAWVDGYRAGVADESKHKTFVSTYAENIPAPEDR